MTTYVALLRGINVGGNRKIRMTDLRDLSERGCGDVASYIQSGNVVFNHPSDRAGIAAELSGGSRRPPGSTCRVVLRSDVELQRVLDANPYGGPEHTTLHIVFLATPPSAEAARAFDASRFAPEEYRVIGREVFLNLPNGLGRAKLPPALPLSAVPARRGTGAPCRRSPA